MSHGVGVFRRAASILRRLRYERVELQSFPVARIHAGVPDGVRWIAPLPIEPDMRATLFCHPASTVIYELNARPGDRFVTGCALMPEVWNRNLGGVQFTMTVRLADSDATVEISRIVDPGTRPEDRRWRMLQLVPRIQREQKITLSLSTRVPEWYAGDNAWAVWGDPSIERPRSRRHMGKLLQIVARRSSQIGVTAALREAGLAGHAHTSSYRVWASLRTPTAETLREMTRQASTLRYQPRITILTPVHNTPRTLLEACARSVMGQVYTNWEWCMCDDGSTLPETKSVLDTLVDPRIRITRLERNGGIVRASQAALAAASGEFVALLDHDDELTPDALFQIVRTLNHRPDADLIYSDEDKRDEDGGLSDPFFKPDWSPDHLLTAMYTCHLTCARKTLIDQAGGFRPGTEGAQDHDLTLRLTELTDRVEHLPCVLYHWRRTPTSTASALSAKPWAEDAGRRAIADALQRRGFGVDVRPGRVPGPYRPRFTIAGEPAVLVVIVGQSSDARVRAADSVRERTSYASCRIALADPSGTAVNAAVQSAPARADYVVVLDASLDIGNDDWLSSLLEYGQQPAIGAVGGKIQYPDKRIRHAGIVLGAGGGVARVLHEHIETVGYFAGAVGVRNYSAVSGECLMTRRDVFDELGGFDGQLPWPVTDVDYCLKVRRSGRRVVYTGFAELHIRPDAVAATLPDVRAIALLRQRWPAALDCDPYYNENFSTAGADYQLSRYFTDMQTGGAA